MKGYNSIFLLLILLMATVAIGCGEDEVTPVGLDPKVQALCTAEGGSPITDMVGLVYKWTKSEPHFYYIGNPQKLPIGQYPGGMIPCNRLPKEFQQEDLLVIYSGINKGTLPDTGDPLFGFMTLTSLEKSTK